MKLGAARLIAVAFMSVSFAKIINLRYQRGNAGSLADISCTR
jgi:hypothetical protein